MVRRATRTYAAIEQGFQALELKESKTRSFFRPFSEQELERLQEDSSFSTSNRHRYVDVLQWSDDVSALVAVDNPAAAEGIKRRQSRAASALMRSRSLAAGSAGARTRPNSAPPGFDPASVGSALQAALQGVVESARSQVVVPHAIKGFESRLIDTYFRAQSLYPAAEPAAAARPPRPESAGTVAAAGPGTGPGPGGVAEADVSNLPLINEGVEDVEEGMDGEELSRDALLLYYGSRRPRRASAAAGARSSSPAHSSMSPPGLRPASAASCQQTRPASSMRPCSASPGGSTRLQQHADQQQQQQQQQRYSRPPSASSSAYRLQRSMSASADRSPATPLPLLRTAPSALHASAARPPARPWSAVPSTAGGRDPAAAGQLRSCASGPVRQPHLDMQGNCLQLGSRPTAKQGPSNGIVPRDPAGPPIATHRARRPLSARSSADAEGTCWASSRQAPALAAPPPAVVAPGEHTLLTVVAGLHAAHTAAGGTGELDLKSVGKHGDVKLLMESQAARQAAMTRASALSGR